MRSILLCLLLALVKALFLGMMFCLVMSDGVIFCAADHTLIVVTQRVGDGHSQALLGGQLTRFGQHPNPDGNKEVSPPLPSSTPIV